MGREYLRVLNNMHLDTVVVGRSKESAEAFKKETGIIPVTGGIENYLQQVSSLPDYAIIAVNVTGLYEVCSLLIKEGIRNILLEKPGALWLHEINDLKDEAVKRGVNVYIAYNRRFYASVAKAMEILGKDGGVISFSFEFTEWSDRVEAFNAATEEKERWFLSNSSHVADLAFYMGGKPARINCYTSGSLQWHKSASIFCGSGISETGALFTYSANWNSPGRWGIELLSGNYRVILRPLEQLQIQKKGSLNAEPVILEDMQDKEFKPGLFRMVDAFMAVEKRGLCTVEEQAVMISHYCKIGNYTDRLS